METNNLFIKLEAEKLLPTIIKTKTMFAEDNIDLEGIKIKTTFIPKWSEIYWVKIN